LGINNKQHIKKPEGAIMSNALTEFKKALDKIDFKQMLPSHIKPERFQQVVVTAIRKSPILLEKNRGSLFSACMECAKDGLIPDGQQAALVPYKNEVRYMAMVKGIAMKVRNSGEILTIDAGVVYSGDEYEAWVDEKGPHFKHKRKFGKDRGDIILTYAYAIGKNGECFFEEIDEAEMQAIKKCSRGSNTPWNGPFENEMRRKSAIRRLAKYRLPSSTDLDQIIRQDDDMYDLNESTADDKDENTIDTNASEVNQAGSTDSDSDADDVNDMTAEPQFKTVQGVVESIKAKNGETNGRKWQKFGGVIDGKLYTTFSATINKLLHQSLDDQQLISIKYDEIHKNDKTFYNIIEADLVEISEENEIDEPDAAELPI
jgi:phage RecT family recombinase